MTVLLISVLIVLSIQQTVKGKLPFIRRIAALDAIEEAIGASVEKGTAVHYTLGYPGPQGLASGASAALMSGILCMGYVAEKTAELDAKLITTHISSDIVPIAEEVIKTAYLKVGVPENYSPDMVRYLSGFQFAYTIAVLGIMERENVGTNIMIGSFMAEALVMAEAGNNLGAMQIGGTTSTIQLPFFVVACDYAILGEEIFAASAYLSKEPIRAGAILGQDRSKYLIVGILVIGVLLQLINNTFLFNLLSG